jgi:hypothetical protein
VPAEVLHALERADAADGARRVRGSMVAVAARGGHTCLSMLHWQFKSAAAAPSGPMPHAL